MAPGTAPPAQPGPDPALPGVAAALEGIIDGIIVGAGAAGLAAALRAASLGVQVAVLDPSGGADSNLAYSGGMFTAAGTRFQAAHGVDDGAERWEADVRRQLGGAVDGTILRTVTSRSAEVAHFLADYAGLDLHLVTGATVADGPPRLHATPGESGRELAALMLAATRRASVQVLETEALALSVADGRVVGVETARGTLRAPWTLLASGGFAANRVMLAAHAPEVATAVYIGNPGSDGRAIAWGRALGADTLFMGSYQGQGHVAREASGHGRGRLGPGLGSFGAIAVNARGERFADETMSPSSFAAPVLAQPGGWAVELFDAAADAAARRFGPYRELAEAGGVQDAATVGDLAARFGLPEAALADTLAQLERIAAGTVADRFGRTRHLRPLVPPFRAATITGALAHTQGGLRVDSGARVLRGDGTAIPGLLAAGGAAASISGHGAAGYVPGNGLAHAFALGMAAADTMAAHRAQLARRTG